MPPYASRLRGTLTCLLLLLAGCGRGGTGELPKIPPQDQEWGGIISQHTRGAISRRDRIRLVFLDDVVSEERVGETAASVLTAYPAIEGSVTFASTREIVIVPSTDLPQGQAYRVMLSPEDLIGIPPELDRYEFLVQVMRQDFEVEVTGFVPDSENDSILTLRGVLLTADFDEIDDIEQVVSATFLGVRLQTEWLHDVDGKRHEFTVSNIRRQARNELLRVAWDGDPIGVDASGEQPVAVPSVGTFAVTSVDAVQEERQYVAVYFSDALDPGQNLRGLITLMGSDFTTAVDGNVVRLFPQQRLVGAVNVSVEPGIRSANGKRLERRRQQAVTFAGAKPGVRFAGPGVILPGANVYSYPIEAINVHSVQVTAFQIYETNVGQFLQTNALDGSRGLGRVGRSLWRRTVPLGALGALGADHWNRYSLDLTDLMRSDPGGMVRLTLSINRGNSSFGCSEEENRIPVVKEGPLANLDDENRLSNSNWDGFATYFGVNANFSYRDRNDPCKDAYYRWSNQARASRNFLVSNIGIVAKRDQQGTVLIATTDLRTAEPMADVSITFMNYQDRPIGHATTDRDGIAEASFEGTPFYALAEKGDDRAYLRMNAGGALQTSHFDVGGVTVAGGLKGFIYGERGVWRPGDDLHFTFLLEDGETPVPANHPTTLRLYNPQGQLIQDVTNSTPTDGFYTFALSTPEDAPTGTWTAAADVGGSHFSMPVRIETVIPNRLKVELDVGEADLLKSEQPLRASLFGQWLSGATARNLEADVEVRLIPSPTRFDRFTDFSFDDPAREFKGEPQQLFKGALDDEGRTSFTSRLTPAGDPPGMLSAHFSSRVFEGSGAFSTSRRTVPFSPYSRYVGIRLPPGDVARGMLLTDTTHTVEIATLTEDGAPVSVDGIQVSLYKIEWKWWWDQSGESLAKYASSQHRAVIERGEINTVDGYGTWPLRVDYPAWGRYLLRACDPDGRHCTGRVFYIDWPGWAGRAREQSGAGANVLTVVADKESYLVGEVAQIQLPEATEGRALVTFETGTRILEQRWIEFDEGRTRFEIPITAEMTPNMYVGVTLIQPYEERSNDRPIRLYGVIPLAVVDPDSRLEPEIRAADEWRPETDVMVEVSEASGRRMTYTLAIVDEGLLGLTNFATPDPHAHFFQKEALGVTTWDMYDYVVGAYGGELERLLALGGDETAEELEDVEDRRFPPVVRFLGPFTLDPGASNSHTVDIPQYIGAVRVMVVAADEGAYGATAKSVFVRQPLSLLATVPRVVGPDEEVSIALSLFAMQDGITEATVQVETDDHFEVVGSGNASVHFDGPGEQIAFLRFKVGSSPGLGRLRFSARSGEHTARAEVVLEVRSPNPSTIRQWRQQIEPGETWAPNVATHGLPGTNTMTLEVTTIPPLNLEPRLRYLIRYPHGCVEQVTSAVFAQLYLPSLIQLDPARREEVERNVRAGIDRLRGFQLPTGAFTYWPGGFGVGGAFGARDAWATTYVGHFLVQAEKRGYHVPPEMLADWLNHQRSAAQSWSASGEFPLMDQAYRLYTLALAGRPELGAMNRLREAGNLGTMPAWQLAAAYHLAGLPDIGDALTRGASRTPQEYGEPGWSLGSRLRDLGIILNSMVALDMQGATEEMVEAISEELYSDEWHSTHSIAYALLAMGELYDQDGSSERFTFARSIGSQRESITSDAPIYTTELDVGAASQNAIRVSNTSNRLLYASFVVEGVPAAGDERASSSGLDVGVEYVDSRNMPVDVTAMRQGTDFLAHVTVHNRTLNDLDNLALEHRVPSGWEIHNPRMDGDVGGTQPVFEYQDIRDDRIHTYFALKAGETKTFSTRFNAAYLGSYYLPSISVEAMYDATKNGRTTGRWIQVTDASR